jgi:peptidoglycan/LPS O-acetylase OafA/YrhL
LFSGDCVYGLALLVFFIYHLVFNKQIDFKGLISNIALVQSWIPKYALSFNYPGWSLSTEVLFYLSFPFLFNYFYKKYTLKKIFITIICFFILSQLIAHIFKYSSFYDEYLPESHNFIFYFPLMHLNQFLVGNIAGLFFLKFIKKKNYDFWIIVLVLMIPVLLKLNTGAIYNNGILACVFVPLIILISANNGFLTRISSMKLPVFLGEISYGIYILQKPIYSWTNEIMKSLSIKNPIFIFYSSLIILILFSAISYKYIETPLRRRINKKKIWLHHIHK